MDVGLGLSDDIPGTTSEPGTWLLATGYWDDDGIWLNSETWNDT